jgi:hypothetical protein
VANKNMPSIPLTKGEVQKKMLNPKFQSGLSVEQAHEAMIVAAEPARTVKGGVKVPTFVQEAHDSRGVGGNTPLEEVQAVPVTVHAPQNELDAQAPPARTTAEQDKQTQNALRFSAQQKLQQAGFRNGVSVDLIVAVKDGILEKNEAEALLGREILIETPATATEEAVLVVAPPAEPVIPVLSDAVKPAEERAPAEPEGQRKRVESKYFVGEIYKDAKIWVAELVYKNGAGTERFTAGNKDDLMLKILEGKGHGTVKVRETVQRYKLGNVFNTWDDFYKEILDEQEISREEFDALPAKSQSLIYDNYQTVYIQQFLAAYPEYYPNPENWKQISAFLKKKGIPLSMHNLELIYKELTDDDLLEVRPAEKVVAPTTVEVAPVSAAAVATVAEDSAPVVQPAAPAPAAPAATTLQPTPRKRGSSGLIPGQSSAAPSALAATEDGGRQRELSVTELRQLPDAELKRLALVGRKYR